MKKLLSQSAKIIFLALLFVGVVVFAAPTPLVGPSGAPATDNADLPINVSANSQTKTGGITAGLLNSIGNIFSGATAINSNVPGHLSTGSIIADQFCLTGDQGSTAGCINDWPIGGTTGGGGTTGTGLPPGTAAQTLYYFSNFVTGLGSWKATSNLENDGQMVTVDPGNQNTLGGQFNVKNTSIWLDLSNQAPGSTQGRNAMLFKPSLESTGSSRQDVVLESTGEAFRFWGGSGTSHPIKIKAGSVDSTGGPVSIDLSARPNGSFEGRHAMSFSTSPNTGGSGPQPAVFYGENTGDFRFVDGTITPAPGVYNGAKVSTGGLQADSLITQNVSKQVCADAQGVLILCAPTIAPPANYVVTYSGAGGGPFPGAGINLYQYIYGDTAKCKSGNTFCDSETFIVPDGVYKIKVSLVGSGGAGDSFGGSLSGDPGTGGQAGGFAQAIFDVIPGQKFGVFAAPHNRVDYLVNGQPIGLGGNSGKFSAFGESQPGAHDWFLFGYGGAGGGHTTGNGCSTFLPPLDTNGSISTIAQVSQNGGILQGGRGCGGFLGGDPNGGQKEGEPAPNLPVNGLLSGLNNVTPGAGAVNLAWDAIFPPAVGGYEYGHSGIGSIIGAPISNPVLNIPMDGKAGAVVVQWSTDNNGYGTFGDSHSSYQIWNPGSINLKIPLRQNTPITYSVNGGGGGGGGATYLGAANGWSNGFNGQQGDTDTGTFYSVIDGIHNFFVTVGGGGPRGVNSLSGAPSTNGNAGQPTEIKDVTINVIKKVLGGAAGQTSTQNPTNATVCLFVGCPGAAGTATQNPTNGKDGYLEFSW